MQKQQPEIYFANRGPEFKNIIRKVLLTSKLKPHYITLLTDDQSMKLYARAFTHETADPENNYQYLEILGDATANDNIVWYMNRRFPQIQCAEGVKVLARLKINYGSKKTFYKFAEELGFWPFISADEIIRQTKMKSCLEDVFEAFFGVTQLLLDSRIRKGKITPGVGNGICYNIISSIFDKIDISLKYEDLFDSKTILKELFEYKAFNIGNIKYTLDKIDRIQHARVIQRIGGRSTVIGKGSAAKKAAAEQKAAAQALAYLKRRGIEKPVSESYKLFCLPSQF